MPIIDQSTNSTSIKISNLNCRTLDESDLPALNRATGKCHVTFLTEVNIRSDIHRAILEYDPAYVWFFIAPNPDHQQRIAVRIPRKYHANRKIRIRVLKQDYITEERTQEDQCAVQYMVLEG